MLSHTHKQTTKTKIKTNKQTKLPRKGQKANLVWDWVMTAALEGDQAVGEQKEKAPLC